MLLPRIKASVPVITAPMAHGPYESCASTLACGHGGVESLLSGAGALPLGVRYIVLALFKPNVYCDSTLHFIAHFLD